MEIRSKKVNVYDDVLKTIRDILINDTTSEDEELTLKDFCNNRAVQQLNLSIPFLPTVVITLEEEDSSNNFTKNFRLTLGSWVKTKSGIYKVGTERYPPKTYAMFMGKRINFLLENEQNILGAKCVINTIEGISGLIDQEIEKYKAYSKISIFRMIVMNKKN